MAIIVASKIYICFPSPHILKMGKAFDVCHSWWMTRIDSKKEEWLLSVHRNEDCEYIPWSYPVLRCEWVHEVRFSHPNITVHQLPKPWLSVWKPLRLLYFILSEVNSGHPGHSQTTDQKFTFPEAVWLARRLRENRQILTKREKRLANHS